MKKIIKGKVYDTDKAECVGEWDNGYYPNDFNYCSENLYRKRTGEFFLYGEGGARSIYATSTGSNSWGGGQKIIPLTYDAAQEWAEEHLTGDEYEAIFGDVVVDESRAAITLSMPVADIERAKRAAAQANISLSAYFQSLLP